MSCATKPTVIENENEILINATSKVTIGNDYEIKISKIITPNVVIEIELLKTAL